MTLFAILLTFHYIIAQFYDNLRIYQSDIVNNNPDRKNLSESDTEIAAIMSVGKSTISRWLKKKTVPGVPTAQNVPGAGQTGQWDTNQRQYEEELPLPPAEI